MNKENKEERNCNTCGGNCFDATEKRICQERNFELWKPKEESKEEKECYHEFICKKCGVQWVQPKDESKEERSCEGCKHYEDYKKHGTRYVKCHKCIVIDTIPPFKDNNMRLNYEPKQPPKSEEVEKLKEK